MFSLSAIAGLVALIPGGGSLWGIVATAFGAIARCKPCLYVLVTAALCGWTAFHVHRADVARCEVRIETRLEQARQQAADAARDRDAGIRADLEKSYGPGMLALRRLAEGLQQKVNDNAKQKPVSSSGAKPVACKLGPAARLLQPAPAAR